jgi:hypothetical protein
MAKRSRKSKSAKTSTAPTKRYSEMTLEELNAATAEFDDPNVDVGASFNKPVPRRIAIAMDDMRERHGFPRLHGKRGRPRLSKAGTVKLGISLEKGLAAKVDRYAAANQMKRSEVISRAVAALVA